MMSGIGIGSFSRIISGVFQQILSIHWPYPMDSCTGHFYCGDFRLCDQTKRGSDPAGIRRHEFLQRSHVPLAHIFTRIGYLFIAIFSASWFAMLWKDGTVFVAIPFMITFLTSVAVVILVILPLLYAFFTKSSEIRTGTSTAFIPCAGRTVQRKSPVRRPQSGSLRKA
jgi:hypothetical protein